MDYPVLLDLATNLGYELAMAGAETFRVEESINRVMAAYGVEAEVFAIPNYLAVNIVTEDGQHLTRMRRIGVHGNDLDAVEKFSNLSRALCNRKPDPAEGLKWLDYVRSIRRYYSLRMYYVGCFLAAVGFSMMFGGNLIDAVCAGICGLIVGFVNKTLDSKTVNSFFQTIASAFFMAVVAYGMGAYGITSNPDAVIIGALMLLVPGLLFTNAMRDIIYGDTNSGINRVVQVFLIGAAIVLGTATAWNLADSLWGAPVSVSGMEYSILVQCICAWVACLGFAILFNIHGPGILICAVGGLLAWGVYCVVLRRSGEDLLAYFWSAIFSSFYAEIMARIRKYPAISYLVVCIFPMIPGAGVYYTMNYAVQGEMELFASKLIHTIAIAGIIAVGILLGSTVFRLYSQWKQQKK